MSASILEKIKTYKLADVAKRKAARPLAVLEQTAKAAPPPRGFIKRLKKGGQNGYGLIAEIKKASPSKGIIRTDFDVPSLAKAYTQGGASCLSVLTDTPSFEGHDAFLKQAKQACDLPVLRKDFLYDVYQVVESRSLGADCILLIMASLDDTQAAELEQTAHSYGMDVLIEVHNAQELERAHKLTSPLVGINNRDLNTFTVTLDTTKALCRHVAPDRMIVSESGLFTPQDLGGLARLGVRHFLIGESLMRQPDVARATQALLTKPVPQGGA